MHPLIAFLSFIFSPTDDWHLRQAFELVIDSANLPATVAAYDDLSRRYPTLAVLPNKTVTSLDHAAMALWGEALKDDGHDAEAVNVWGHLLKQKDVPTILADDVRLRLGELMLAHGDSAGARQHLQALAAKPGHRQADAHIDLLACDIAENKWDAARQRAAYLTSDLDVSASQRAAFPLGLLELAEGRDQEALDRFKTMKNDPRGLYFAGLAARRLNKPSEALAFWQKLRELRPYDAWAERADLQVAETYFALGDDDLSRLACEQALRVRPEGRLKEQFSFRLATIDMRAKRYDSALARLAPLIQNSELAGRASIVLAEGLVKAGRNADYAGLTGAGRRKGDSAEGLYQMAWAHLQDKNFEKAVSVSDRGLRDHFDPQYTPRLLILQGAAFEHLGQTAHALATYQTVIDRFPKSAPAAISAHWTTVAYMRLGRLREAVTHGSYIWNGLDADGKRGHPEAAFWLAQAQGRLNRQEDADRYYGEFLTFAEPSHALTPYALFEKSATLARLNRIPDSLSVLDQFARVATAANKTEWISLAHIQRGHIQFNEKQYANAVASYRAAGATPKSLYFEGLALHRMDYFNEAVQAWTRLAQAHPQDPYAEAGSFKAARTQFELGLATEAVAAYTQFVSLYPNSPRAKDARLQAAHALFNAGYSTQAAPLYANYLAHYQQPEDLANVGPYLANCYVQMGKSGAELDALLRGLPPTEAEAAQQWNAGAAAYNEKRYADASQTFEFMLTRYPTYDQSAAAMFFRAESYFLQNKWAEAEHAYNVLVQLDTEGMNENTPLALLHQGVAAYNQDRLLRAAQIFETILQRFPTMKVAADAREHMLVCYHNLGAWDTMEEKKRLYSADMERADKGGAVYATTQTDWSDQ